MAARWTKNGNIWRFVVFPLSLSSYFSVSLTLFILRSLTLPSIHNPILVYLCTYVTCGIYNSYIEPPLRGI